MEIKTKFNIGDKVWVINEINGYEKCPKCKGNGEVLVDNIDYYCKMCYGEGKVLIQTAKWRANENSNTITQIRIFTDEGGTDVAYYDGNIITSEYLGAEKNCFSTREEAQEECDRRNK